MKPLYKARADVCSRAWIMSQQQGHELDLPSLMRQANLYRQYYGLEAVDLVGVTTESAEKFRILIEHCVRIGLFPSLRGEMPEGDLVRRFEDVGVVDWMVPTTQEGLDRAERPVRFYTRLHALGDNKLPVKELFDRPATVWDVVFYDSMRESVLATSPVVYAEVMEELVQAVDVLEAAGWEVNLRHLPLCIAKQYGLEANASGFHQMAGDPWEYRIAAQRNQPLDKIILTGGWAAAELCLAQNLLSPRNNPTCHSCQYRMVCDRPSEQYQREIGIEELTCQHGDPTLGEEVTLVTDPLIFQKARGVAA